MSNSIPRSQRMRPSSGVKKCSGRLLPLEHAEVGDDPLGAGADQLDVLDVDGDRVTRLGAFDVQRPGQRIADVEVEVVERVARLELLIAERVGRLDQDSLARRDRRARRVLGRVREDTVRSRDPPRFDVVRGHAVASANVRHVPVRHLEV